MTKEKAKDRAWTLINDNRELFDSTTKSCAVEIISKVIIEVVEDRDREWKARLSDFSDEAATMYGQITINRVIAAMSKT